MIEHENLVNELNELEGFNPQERLEHARQRRKAQLSNYHVHFKSQDYGNVPIQKCSHDKNIRFEPNITLIEASARNDADEVQKLLTLYADIMSPNLQNEDGLSALHQAVIEDCADVVEVLVNHGANLDIKDADLWTPLHAAVACGNYDLAKYLIDNGASLIEINTDGNMPIDLDNEDNEDIEILLDECMVKAGFTEESLDEIRLVIPRQMLNDLRNCVEEKRDINITGEHGETACHIAAANGYQEVLEFLLDHGAKFDIGDKDLWQPIHAAACWGHDRIVEILVNHGADLEAMTKDGETPLDLTEDEEMQEIINELKESGKNESTKVRRSVSNSSRTLSVRRSSSMEKRQTSINDAKQEFKDIEIYRHSIEIPVDDDPNGEIVNGEHTNGNYVDGEVGINYSLSPNATDQRNFEHEKIFIDEKKGFQDNKHHVFEQKEVSIDINSTDFNESKIVETSDNCIVDIPMENKTFVKTLDQSADKQFTNISSNKGGTCEQSDVEIGVVSVNTAAKKESNHKLNDSNELTVKKKCCTIL